VTAASRADRKYLIIVLVLFAGVSSLVVIAAYPRFKKIEKRGPAPQSVATVLPGDLDAVATSIGDTFNNWREFIGPNRIGSYQNRFPPDSPWSHFFLFHKNDPQYPLFPSDDEILLDRGVDSFVKRYVSIPPQLRGQDLYLDEPSGDYYWKSEYFYKGQPAKFRCSFLIHLEPAEASGTKVEIFEYQPTIWVGEYFGFSAHAPLPTTLHDIRPAEETSSDRKAILRIIQGAPPS
jgi:hypothetical protein